jgi:hypothetical protein
MAMRIEVTGTDSTTPQARAYAEYRLFATLARHTREIRSVRVALGHAGRGGSAALCVVNLDLEPAGSARVRAQGPHALGAIDRAAARIGDLMARRSSEGTSS